MTDAVMAAGPAKTFGSTRALDGLPGVHELRIDGDQVTLEGDTPALEELFLRHYDRTGTRT
ncbi:hypothetical protein [Nonomuraea endophytica]|uniref:hypothetical protein n=1 Tax=Nonomuraea endophytica TaxID=714136 RepID=UPI0037C63876